MHTIVIHCILKVTCLSGMFSSIWYSSLKKYWDCFPGLQRSTHVPAKARVQLADICVLSICVSHVRIQKACQGTIDGNVFGKGHIL
jgi:hypothetical protein